ncbi:MULTISPECIES: hypothetical protein [Burkholderia]|uniref:hypothetical protein n=1 Tax=Burkholderia TaxID=32008 RepID=UPI00039A5AF0|nr:MULTISPECIES: hypothetical protein [Burkholderia]KGS56519.1 hypothetical protein X949_4268 [Burkholderia pseudomallei MSHR5609]KGU72060.1 hypothetical protein X883_1692 [Burkholderia pseudomallei MSHR4304]KGV34687.1 hypothetical protein X884_5608 [Burkholderia pseudomallei MSHR4308]KGW20999.1 hypothetical protein Y047_3427 [Burkholderia pseudomallei MSHR3016]KHJ61183.1 hypothetical protein NCPPB3923_20120 [Burkholderia glumae]
MSAIVEDNVKVIADDAMERIESVIARLRKVGRMASLYADMTGTNDVGLIQVDGEALMTAMQFFADELLSALPTMDRLQEEVGLLANCCTEALS